jgi:hypothetical protein
LTERVVKAMWMTKLRVMAALLVTVSLLGAGAGFLAHQAVGADPRKPQGAAGESAAAPPQREQRGEADRGRATEGAALEKAQAALETLEKEIQKREEVWAEELMKAQLQVLDAEEDLRQVERQFALERERERQDSTGVEQELRRQKSPTVPRPDPVLERTLETQLKMLDDRWKEREQMRNTETRQRRHTLFVAEAHLRLLERQQEAQRARAQELLRATEGRVRATEERLRQIQLGEPQRRESGREADLERKLDQILRELTEIRLALRRPGGGKPLQPDRRPPQEP